MNIAFLGGIFPKHLEESIFKNSNQGIQFAANNLQWKIILGLDLHNEKPIQICNLVFVGSYPFRYKQLFLKTAKFSHTFGSKDINHGFFNLTGFKYLSRTLVATRGLLKWGRNHKSESAIIIYSIHTPFLIAAMLTKIMFKSIKLCLIIPDLPEFMSDSRNSFYRFFKRIDKIIIERCLKFINGFVVLSEHMVSSLRINNRPWIRIEGIGSDSLPNNITQRDSEHMKVILYSGTLARIYGIINLLDAFRKIRKSNYRLWICGEGDAKEVINKRAAEDERIKYYGKLPLNEVLRLQMNATVLVNPRTSEGEFTKYSFPSKIIEYLSSGTPTIMHRLLGIPKEYFNYCFIEETETVNGLSNQIVSVCEMSKEKRREIGLKARNFILSEKNPSVQGKKIHQFLLEFIDQH